MSDKFTKANFEAMTLERDALKRMPDPEGWEQTWYFYFEAALWLIPEEQREAALKWEIGREAGKPGRPWLLLAHHERKRAEYEPPAVQLISYDRLEDALEANSPGFHDMPEPMQDPWETGRKILSLSIDPERGVEEIGAQFKEILSELNLKGKHGTRKMSAINSNLISVSLLRLRHWLPPESFFEPLRETEFQFWGDSKTAPEIREKADKRRERIKAKLREEYTATALSAETYLERVNAPK